MQYRIGVMFVKPYKTSDLLLALHRLLRGNSQATTVSHSNKNLKAA